MRKQTSIADANRVALGLVLVGFGALALQDRWFPHGLIVVGVALLARHTMQHQPSRTAYLAISLFVMAGMFWGRDQLLQAGLGEWVPIWFVVVGGSVLGGRPPLTDTSPPHQAN